MATLDDRLDAAIDDLLSGVPTTNLDPELAGLLAPASVLLSSPVPASMQLVAQGRMMASIRAQRERPSLWAWLGLGFRHVLRLAPMAAVAVLIILVILSGSALPGQPHYPLKRGVEALRVLGIQDPATRSVFYVELAKRRLTELEMLVIQERPISVGHIESIGRAWTMALATPGADTDQFRKPAMAHARRLQALIPFLSPQLQAPAQDVLNELMRLAGLANPSPTPTALPTETPVPPRQETSDTPILATVTPTPRPVATATPTPVPTATVVNTATPEPTATATAPPPATATPDDPPTLTSTFTPVPTNAPAPAPTRTPTQPVEPTQTPGSTETPEATETPEPEESETPEPEESETPEPEETEEPEPDEPEETETPETSSSGLN